MIFGTGTPCTSNEFACNDGACIGMEHRCNGRTKCTDKSDERGCKIVSLDESYNKEITPPPEKGDLSEVGVSIEIENILEIDEIGGMFRSKYYLTTSWYDSRLSFHNLKRNKQRNILGKGEQSSIWTPQMVFSNTNNNDETATDNRTTLKVIPNNDFKYDVGDSSYLHNIQIFSGSSNQLEMSRSYSTSFLCTYKLSWYPFDTQLCSMDIR